MDNMLTSDYVARLRRDFPRISCFNKLTLHSIITSDVPWRRLYAPGEAAYARANSGTRLWFNGSFIARQVGASDFKRVQGLGYRFRVALTALPALPVPNLQANPASTTQSTTGKR